MKQDQTKDHQLFDSRHLLAWYGLVFLDSKALEDLGFMGCAGSGRTSSVTITSW